METNETAINEILFTLLRSQICEDEKIAVAESLSQDTLAELYRISKAHDLAHIISNGLHKQGLLGADETSQKFRNAQMSAVLRYQRMQYALEQIAEVFEKEEIPYIPLKGAILRSFYPQNWMRTSCDIDILVRQEDLQHATQALVKTLAYRAADRTEYHDISLFSKNGVHLELHFSIKENMENIDRLLSKVWEYASPVTKDSCCHRQTNEYFLFHHIAHMSYHFVRGGCGIKPFMDLYILRNKMAYEENVVADYCKQCGIETFYRHVLDVTDIWFGNKSHTPVSLRIEQYILKGGVYGTLENQVLVAQSKQGSKLKYFLLRIFMPYDSLKDYYPVLQKHPYLFPVMQICRWFRILFCGDTKRSMKELSYNSNISRSQAEEMKDFLNQIGL